MAHTDRDDEEWARRNHHRNLCPNAYARKREAWLAGGSWLLWQDEPCHFCDHDRRPRYYCSTDSKGGWNQAERRAERSRAKQAIRECRDWDELSIRYRRPYWD